MPKIAVTSPSFSRNQHLVSELQKHFSQLKLNTEGKRFSEEELIEYIADSEAIIVGLDKISKEVINQSPKLKIIAKYGVGLDNIDIDFCKQCNIKIGWTGGTNKRSVAELSLGNILSLIHNSYQSATLLSQGVWKKDGGQLLSHKTVGIIGVGNIGKELIALLQPFGCNILVNDIIPQQDYYKAFHLKETTKETIYKECDIISIHTPLTPETEDLINAQTLAQIKYGAILNNTARGGIVNMEALKKALIKGQISAAIDVYPTEPPTDLSLLSLPNLLCTPHIAGNAKEAVEAMGISAIKHLVAFFKTE